MALVGTALGVAGCTSDEPAQEGGNETTDPPTETKIEQADDTTGDTSTEEESTATSTDGEPATRAAWRGTLGGPGNTCVGTGALSSDLEVDWAFDTGELELRSPTVADGRVHVVGERFDSDSGNYVTKAIALSAGTGEVQWERVLYERGSIPEPPTSAPTVADGTVYVVTSSEYSDGRAFVALTAATGEVEWELAGAAGDHFGGPVAHGDTVVEMASGTAEGDFALRSFKDDGTLEWTNQLGDLAPFVTGLAAEDDTLAVGGHGPYSDAPTLVGIDAATGETRWTVPRDEFDATPKLPPVVHDGSVYVATGLGPLGDSSDRTYRLLSFSLADGTLNWRTALTTRTDRTAIPQGPFAVTNEGVLLLQRENTQNGECEVVRYGLGDGDADSRTAVGTADAAFSGITMGDEVAYIPHAEGVLGMVPPDDAYPIDRELSLSPVYLQNWGMPIVGDRALLTEQSRIVAVA